MSSMFILKGSNEAEFAILISLRLENLAYRLSIGLDRVKIAFSFDSSSIEPLFICDWE